MKKFIVSILLCLISFGTLTLFQGCAAAAVGAGIGAIMYGGAKQKEAYAKYRTDAERINLERERSGLLPQRILTYDEWDRGMN